MTSFEPTPGVEVHALLRSTRLDLAQRILGTRMANVTYTEDAWTLITVRYPDVESVRQLLYLGDHIRILNPAEAVEQFHDLAAQIMCFSRQHKACSPIWRSPAKRVQRRVH